jgi:palmitoyl-protein thioesterase
MRALLARGAYAPWVREHVVQAQYFKDPSDLDAYLASNVFLPDINNERAGERNEQYAANVRALGRLVLYRFDRDSTVVPRDSSWFSFFDGAALVPLRDQPLYKDDYIGLRALDERGGLFLESAPGEHMQARCGGVARGGGGAGRGGSLQLQLLAFSSSPLPSAFFHSPKPKT